MELDDENPDTLAKLGHLYQKLGFPLRARGCFKKAVRLFPGHTSARKGLELLEN